MTPTNLYEPLQRTAVLHALNLSRFSYYFFEAYDDQLIRALKVSAGKVETLLEPWTLTAEQAETLGSAEYPVFLTRHAGYRLPIQAVDAATSILEEILPYPFAQMVACARTEDVAAFTVFPKGLLWSLRRFTSAFVEVERTLASAEFGCLTLSNDEVRTHVLTQQVGRKRTLLATLNAQHLAHLDALFQNRYIHLSINIERQPNLIGQLEHLTLALQGSSAAPRAPETHSPLVNKPTP